MSDESRDVVLEIRIDAAPETVFALLTDPAHMKTWFAEQVDAYPQPGGLFRVSDSAGVSIEGTYLEVVANSKVVFTWGGLEGLWPGQSTVEFLLESDGEGTLLRLRHYRLPVTLSARLVDALGATSVIPGSNLRKLQRPNVNGGGLASPPRSVRGRASGNRASVTKR